MAAPRRHLALVCFLHQAWRDTLDQAVDMYGTLLDRHRTRVDDHLDDRLNAHRHAVDRIVHRDHRLGAVRLDPDIGDAEVRTRWLSIVPETQVREDQSALANWTRGDRQARVEQTAARHAGLRQVAAPFLSRMTCVDEHAAACRPTPRWTSPRRRCSRSSATTARPTGAAGRARCSSRCTTRSRRAPSPSTARSTSAASRRSSCRARSGSRSATRSGRAPDSPAIPPRRASTGHHVCRMHSTGSSRVFRTTGRSCSTTTGGS